MLPCRMPTQGDKGGHATRKYGQLLLPLALSLFKDEAFFWTFLNCRSNGRLHQCGGTEVKLDDVNRSSKIEDYDPPVSEIVYLFTTFRCLVWGTVRGLNSGRLDPFVDVWVTFENLVKIEYADKDLFLVFNMWCILCDRRIASVKFSRQCRKRGNWGVEDLFF